MKKVISLLVAFAAACSVSVAAFAADDTPGTGIVRESRSGDIDISTRISVVDESTSLGTTSRMTVGAHELFIVDNTNRVVGGTYNKLDPDSDYKFRIYYNNSPAAINATNLTDLVGQAHELTGADVKDGSIQLRTVKGSSYIQTAKIKTTGRSDAARYDLEITSRASFGTKLNDVEYTLTVVGKYAEGRVFERSHHLFEVGHEPIADSETDPGENGIITISNDTPVVLKEQFVDIAKSANYKIVNFEGEDGGWRFAGRVSGMPDSNFYYTYDVVPEIVNKFPEQDYKFLNFRAGVTFPTNGEMRIDVSDINDTFNKMHTYLYRNGRLTKVDTTYDTGSNEVVFRTNYLGSFVITDMEITDVDILAEPNEEPEPEPDEGVNEDRLPDHGNPNTGADSAMNVVVTLGLVSLVTASAISRKKNK